MKLTVPLSNKQLARLEACAKKRGVSPEALAAAYVEDWLSIEYPELLGRESRRGIYRDGPIAFDNIAAEAEPVLSGTLLKLKSAELGTAPIKFLPIV